MPELEGPGDAASSIDDMVKPATTTPACHGDPAIHASCRRRLRGVLVAGAAGLLSMLAVAGHAVAGDAGLDQAAIMALLAPTSDFSRPEAGEDHPGGDATSRKSTDTTNAFSNSSGNMAFEKELDFKVGDGIFKRTWVSAPSSTTSGDGLGPLFNSRSCQSCHLKDGRGHPPAANFPAEEAISMFLRLSIPPETDAQKADLAAHKINVVPEPTYGTQLQNLSIQGLDAEGKMHMEFTDVPVTLAGGDVVHLRKPSYSIDHLAYGPLHKDTMISPRLTPQMIGLGLVEAVPAAEILQYADPDDANGDGISGRPNLVWSLEKGAVTIGRFGWKAGTPSIRQQAASAFAGDIGISTSLVHAPSGDCTKRQARCIAAPNGEDAHHDNAEASDQMLDLLTFYAHNLAVPRRRNPAAPEVLAGKKLFYAIGCAGCHRPKLMTGEAPAGEDHLAHQLIWPYSDFLLHDMGPDLADGRPEGVASGREWRTAPLWGIGLTATVSGHEFMLHDGRARGVEEAILWHGGEAQKARDAYAALRQDRA